MKKSSLVAVTVIASALLAALISYNYWDVSLAKYCRGLSQNILDIAEIITIAGESKWYYVLLVPAFLILRFVVKNQFWSMRILYLFIAISVSGLINMLIKWIAGRHRPVDFFNNGLFGFDYFSGMTYETTSFPSGHAVTVFTLAAALGILFPRWGAPAFVVAIIIGLSRVVLTSHYLSDVLVGASTGIIYAVAVKYVFDCYVIKKIEDKG